MSQSIKLLTRSKIFTEAENDDRQVCLSTEGTINPQDLSDIQEALGMYFPTSNLVAGYNVASTNRTGSAIDSYIDISGNGRTAIATSAKSVVSGTGTSEIAGFGNMYGVAAGIPVSPLGMTIVVIYSAVEAESVYQPYYSTPLMSNDNGLGVLIYGGAVQAYNPTRQIGVAFQSTTKDSLVYRYGANETSIFANGKKFTGAVNNATTTAISNIFGYGGAGGFQFYSPRYAAYVYNRTLSDLEIAAINSYHGVAVPTSSLIVASDSFGAGATLASRALAYSNLVCLATGRTQLMLTTQASVQMAGVEWGGMEQAVTNLSAAGLDPVVVMDVGKNDIASNRTAAQLQTDWETQLPQFTSAGASIVGVTLPPRANGFAGGQTASGYETQRLLFNTWLRTQVGVTIDAIADIAADERVGSVTSLASYYSDDIHPNADGHVIYANIIATAIGTL